MFAARYDPDALDRKRRHSESGSEPEPETKPANELVKPKYEQALAKDGRQESRPDDDYSSRYSSVFKRLNAVQQVEVDEEEEEEEEEDVEMQDLVPMPQPELPKDERLVSSEAKDLDWLATPQYVSPKDTKPFKEMNLSETMLKNLKSAGFEEAFSVQKAVIDTLLKDATKNRIAPDFQGDLLVNASTGSGKTLAYLVPLIEVLRTRVVPRVRAIVLVPTRLLITQVTATLLSLSKGTSLSIVSLSNDLPITVEGKKITENVPDIIVTTPGRLVDHITSGSLNLEALRYLVIDEADRLIREVYHDWSSILISKLPCSGPSWRLKTQKLIFSATVSTDAGKLAALDFERPRLIVVNERAELVQELFTVPPTLKEHICGFSGNQVGEKPLLLAKFLALKRHSSVLVFVKTTEASIRLAKLLQELLPQLHSVLSVKFMNSTNNKGLIRKRIFSDFESRKINVLVATDIIARGLDLNNVEAVINYDLPSSAREYVHRVGRTARANQPGSAYSFCFGWEKRDFDKVSSMIGRLSEVVEEEEFEVLQGERDLYERTMERFRALI